MMYSTSDWLQWDAEAVSHRHDPACPPPPRSLNMNRLGAILTGEAVPPIYSLFMYNANTVDSATNAGKIVQDLLIDYLFTVEHVYFLYTSYRTTTILLPP